MHCASCRRSLKVKNGSTLIRSIFLTYI
ncbi:hypothetical protein E6L37_06645 [Enterococcus lactis]|uniref:Uncharacterized protein n=1 Tax=Enterococcus faecium TaxID=1352 RepID=A0A7V7GPR2_ENTFC|nr:hypothetical protein D9Z05_09685 [Enterococcus faecium]TKB00175.1 hypothetical protein E6L37_06645 [Enterococcus lactis]EGP5688109.1 hypothetical protein [Enterococcus faecium]KAA0691786.1 hypothetical protein DTX73_04575 [Enterococcus faecium]QPB63672.1 hypothetical protein GFB66_09475 [Enterococcus faecium]